MLKITFHEDWNLENSKSICKAETAEGRKRMRIPVDSRNIQITFPGGETLACVPLSAGSGKREKIQFPRGWTRSYPSLSKINENLSLLHYLLKRVCRVSVDFFLYLPPPSRPRKSMDGSLRKEPQQPREELMTEEEETNGHVCRITVAHRQSEMIDFSPGKWWIPEAADSRERGQSRGYADQRALPWKDRKAGVKHHRLHALSPQPDTVRRKSSLFTWALCFKILKFTFE